MFFILTYITSENYLESRKAYRDAHLSYVKLYMDEGKLVMGGALTDPPDRAIIVWDVEDIDTIETFVENDPYYINGVMTGYSIRPWNVVINKYESE